MTIPSSLSVASKIHKVAHTMRHRYFVVPEEFRSILQFIVGANLNQALLIEFEIVELSKTHHNSLIPS